jgi:hypothetical protein
MLAPIVVSASVTICAPAKAGAMVMDGVATTVGVVPPPLPPHEVQALVPPPPHPVNAAKANPNPALNISFPQGTASFLCICCLIVDDLLSALVANRGS